MRNKSLIWIAMVIVVSLVSPPTARGASITDARVHGNELRATVGLANGTAADLTITFERVVGLTLRNVGLSVHEILPTDLSLLSRLPDDDLISVPASFPLLVQIEPPATGGLAFSGVVRVGLYTHGLTYTAGCPLRLFAASLGGPFSDITEWMGAGSYRVRGAKGDFSEFIVAADLRPVDSVIVTKFDRLDDLMDEHGSAIESSLAAALAGHLSSARSAYDQGDTVAAIRHTEAFAEEVEEADGEEIPHVWRSSRDVTNVAGLLRAAAATLRFSLTLKSNSAP